MVEDPFREPVREAVRTDDTVERVIKVNVEFPEGAVDSRVYGVVGENGINVVSGGRNGAAVGGIKVEVDTKTGGVENAECEAVDAVGPGGGDGRWAFGGVAGSGRGG